MKKLVFLIICIFCSFGCIAKDLFSVVTREDRNVYVVALERETESEPSNQWNPTLYKIDVIEARIVAHKKIADQGAPIYCERLGNDQIRIYIHEGTASNGSFADEPLTKELIIDKKTMAIVRQKITQGHDEYEFQQPSRNHYSDKLKNKGTVLGEFIKGSVFLISWSGQDILLKSIRPDSLDEVLSIPLNKSKVSLGGFGGQINTVWWGQQKLLLLFGGNSHLGFFASGCVSIIDINTKHVEYVPIGSDPSMGIAY